MTRILSISAAFFFLLFVGGGRAVSFVQEEKEDRVDSLRLLIEQDKVGDSLKMEALNNLGLEMRPTRPSKALEYSKKALAIAEDLDYPVITAKILTDIGHLYWRLGDFNMSFDFLLEARHIFQRENNLAGYARTLNHIGILLSEQGHYDNGLEYYYRALNIFEEIDSIAYTASVLNNIGFNYQHQHDYDLAEEYHMRSLAISEENNIEPGVAFSLTNLGSVSQDRGKYEEALAYYEASLEIRERYPDIRNQAATHRNIGYLYYEMGDYSKALEELELARALFEEVSDNNGLARVYNNLGDVYVALDHLLRAQNYYYRSLSIAERIDLPSVISKNLLSLGQLMAMKNDYTSAYRYQEKYLVIQDSIYDEESKRRAIEIQLLYDRERKDSEIEILRKTNQISTLNLEKQRMFNIFLLLFIIIILVLLLVIYYRFLETRRTNRMLESQKEQITQYNKQLHDLNDKLLIQKQKMEELNNKLKKSEKHLISVNKTKDKFFSIISHDLRNPFASIVSFSRILKRDIQNLSKEELQQLTVELDKSVLKINSLLENLLQWSRTQTGKIKYEPEYFELKDIIRDNVNIFSVTAREKNIEISDKVPDNLVVWGDVNMTNTIIRNLLSNALKYSYPGCRVVLSSRKLNGMIEISVSDDGIGISEEDQKKLFRVDSLYTTYGTQDEKGSGLGLLLCKEFVNKQGGDIYTESKKGEGSVFSFTIPLEKPTQ